MRARTEATGKVLACVVALLVTGWSVSEGATTSWQVTDWAVIENGAGRARVLFRLEEPSLPEGAVIHRATLRIPLGGIAAERQLTLEVLPITSPWAAGTVRWSGGWSRPGGDVLDEVYTRTEVDLARGAHTLGLDLTGPVKEALEEGRTLHGFMIRVPPYAGEGIRVEDISRFGSLASARVDVTYRVIPRPTR